MWPLAIILGNTNPDSRNHKLRQGNSNSVKNIPMGIRSLVFYCR